jgi:VanZ family protein
MPFLVLIFIALIVYGSLFPFSGWTNSSVSLFSFLGSWPTVLEKADLIQNVLAYAPLGLFTVIWLMKSMRFWPALMRATLMGGVLSFVMESIQQFLPSRMASTSDLAMNLLGTFAGGLAAAFLTQKTFSGARFLDLRNHWLHPGILPNIGLITLALWMLSQTSPLVPTFDIAQLRYGLSLLFHSLQTPEKREVHPDQSERDDREAPSEKHAQIGPGSARFSKGGSPLLAVRYRHDAHPKRPKTAADPRLMNGCRGSSLPHGKTVLPNHDQIYESLR